MDGSTLPKEIRGQWIWADTMSADPESYVFFRREFSLNEIPASADLAITARSFFHVYVNGHHLSYALATHPGKGSYVWTYDITYLLATGANTIAVLAHTTTVARNSCVTQPPGFWCQLNVGGAPAIWTDRAWQVLPGDCFGKNRPRQSTSGGFSERVDLQQYPHGWQRAGFGGANWRQPALCEPYNPKHWTLSPFPGPEFTSSALPVKSLEVNGAWRRGAATTHVSFTHLADRKGDGVYVAEAYIKADEDMTIPCGAFADNPYRFFVNGEAVNEQGLLPLVAGASHGSCKSLPFRQGSVCDPMGTITLLEGWNRLNVFLDVVPGTSGFTLALPTFPADKLQVRRVASESAMPGWAIAGPIRTPLVNILGNLRVTGAMEKEYYVPASEDPVSEALELTMCDFLPDTPVDHAPRMIDEKGVSLKAGDYVVLSVDRVFFGCPSFRVSGTRGDVIDVVSGTELSDGYVVPVDGGREKVDTVRLADAETQWMSCFPKAVKHIMVVARGVKSTVTLRGVELHVRHYAFDNGGEFDSSDEILNSMWRVGKNTLSATVQEGFLDSPSKEQTQYVPDALIQSWAGYFTHGNYSLSAKGLAEFAASQFETGELPAAAPSGLYLNIPDFALLWIVWLNIHYTATGDRKLLDRLLPTAEKIFDYFDEITDPELGVLYDLGPRFKAYCFLDHTPIERRGLITGLNALYTRALLTGAALFDTVNREELSALLHQRLNKAVTTLRELTWDDDQQLFVDCWYDGRQSSQASPQTNILALYGGLASPDQYDTIFDSLYQHEPPFERVPGDKSDNPYFKYFLLETAFAIGRREWAFNYMKWYWGGMLEKGATTWWELFNPLSPTVDTPGSSCHGYGVSPNAFLIREVAGIRPAIPGYSAIYFNPLISSLKSVKTKIPTHYGHISLEWTLDDNNQLDATINATYPLAVIPELDPAIAATATLTVGDEVSIFAEHAE
ncbi:MAG: alpha-L-rhamnosidase N-terminal domain-containing protein [Lentisphaeria bacterium]|nr:alpha-L-rhamnosidase N-terminal domain-containing protein [Lentisphaeria bacterium]